MISVVLPTYNERWGIQEALPRRASEALRKAGEGHDLIAVDDCSPDGAADRAEVPASEIPFSAPWTLAEVSGPMWGMFLVPAFSLGANGLSPLVVCLLPEGFGVNVLAPMAAGVC